MARKGYGRPATLVDITSYPDDGSSPVGSNEWNANPKTDGILGFTKSTAGISSNGITIKDSFIEVTDAGTIHKILPSTQALSATNYGSGTDGASTSIKSFGEGDLIYVIKANGVGTVTLNHQQSGVTDGKINTLTGSPIVLDENVPKIFMCRNKDQAGNLEWFEYGGGTASDLDTTNFASGVIDTDLTSVANTDTTIPSAKATKAFAEARANHTGTQTASTISDFDTEVANNSAVTANTAKVTNATHTGDVTGSTTLTYNNAVPVSKGGTTLTGFTAGDVLYASSSTALARLAKPSSPDGEVLTFANGASAPSWAAASGGGATATHAYTNQGSTSYRGTGSTGTGINENVAVGTEASGAGEREIYIRKIDANNEGVFAVIHKNGSTVEVQIA